MDKDLLAAVQSIAETLKPHPSLFQAISPYIALILSMVAIGMQLYVLNRNAGMNLFQHRIKVYTALRVFVDSMLFDVDVTEKTIDQFGVDILQAQFLFGAEVVRHLRDVAMEAKKLHHEMEHSAAHKAMISTAQEEAKNVSQTMRDEGLQLEYNIDNKRKDLMALIMADEPLFARYLKMRRGRLEFALSGFYREIRRKNELYYSEQRRRNPAKA